MFSAITRARGDTGARNLLLSNNHKIEDVLVSDGGIVRDIDYPDDLVKFTGN